jgi:simple sugar transport system substrate-binding protein
MTDRAGFLHRAGVGVAGLSIAQLLGPAAAFAEGEGNFPDHPRWRFVFVSHDTLDPLFVATQFGAQDAAALVGCSVRWTGSPRGRADEIVKSLRETIAGKADGIAVSGVDSAAFANQVEVARRRGIPLVAFNVDAPPEARRLPYFGENPVASGSRVGAEIARLSPRQPVALLVPEGAKASIERRLEGVLAAIARAPRPPVVTVTRLKGALRSQQASIAELLETKPRLRGLYALERTGTTAAGAVVKEQRLRGRGFHAGGYDLLPGDLELVADGYLDFVVDQQPYVQGFAPVIHLFLARISQGTVIPSDTETSVLLRRADVGAFLETKSRFEGSSSRHEYPLRRA